MNCGNDFTESCIFGYDDWVSNTPKCGSSDDCCVEQQLAVSVDCFDVMEDGYATCGHGHKHLSDGVIAAIVICTLAGVALLAFVLWCILRGKCGKKGNQTEDALPMSDESDGF